MHKRSTISQPNLPYWQHELGRAFRDVGALLAQLELHHLARELPAAILNDFPLRVPRGFVARMRPGDEHDPLLLQVLPRRREADQVSGYGPDPVGDLVAHTGHGILQKYAQRALVITTGACAINCRYCFRRAFPYHDATLTNSELSRLSEHLGRHAGLTEVILSGGDPLTLPDPKLARLIDAVAQTDSIKRVRIHTRVPIVLPERVDDGLIDTLATVSDRLIVVLHCNHANEIDANVQRAAERLLEVSPTLLNQSVLLKGVNDDPATLIGLSEKLFAAHIMPYYLHQLDPVAGAAHFAVDDERARRLIGETAARLPGYLVPRLVREHAGERSKTILAPLAPF